MARLLLTAVFGLMILATHLHCVVGGPLAQPRAAGGTLAMPPRDALPQGCDNPSGCICRGATLALQVEPPESDACWQTARLARLAAGPSLRPGHLPIASQPGQFWKALFPAGKLRALHQAFLL